jgi:hypothetical protein
MKYPCRVQLLLSPAAYALLRKLAVDREESLAETARYGLTVWAQSEERKQARRRDSEQRLLTLREEFLSKEMPGQSAMWEGQ